MSQGWSDEELKASVDAYRVMLEKQNAQKKFVKAHVYRELALRFGREEGAFERRMQNISSIYQESGFNWVQGLKPQKNIGSVIKPRLVEMIGLRAESNLVDHELDKAETDAEQDRAFSPLDVEDARARVVTSIIRRRGQPAFRKKILATYDYRCAITDWQQIQVLEAAHIHPYKGLHTHAVTNGLLLRADLHTLFDLYLIAIEPQTRLIRLSPKLCDSAYTQYEGMPLREPTTLSERVGTEVLQWHADHCTWLKSPSGSSD